MTHEEARELLELAAAEPDGFERLAAGDRPEAAILAGHLAACPSCRAEHDALRRLAAILRTVLPELPAADLRDRTLAAVAALGRPRGAARVAPLGAAGVDARAVRESAATEPAAATLAPAELALEPERGAARGPITLVPQAVGLGWRGRRLRVVGLAAALLVALTAGLVVGMQSREGELRRQDAAAAALEHLAVTSLDVAAAPDAAIVALASSGGRAEGRVLFSAASRRLVVIASGLAPPPADREYRCWVEIGGARIAVGKMAFADDLAYWAGPAAVLAAGSPTRFGISLVPVDATQPGEPVLEGQP